MSAADCLGIRTRREAKGFTFIQVDVSSEADATLFFACFVEAALEFDEFLRRERLLGIAPLRPVMRVDKILHGLSPFI